MADTTLAAQRRRLGIPEVDTRPQPLRQSLWILASVAIVGLTLVANADRIGRAGATATSGIEAARLIELADGHQPTRTPANTEATTPMAPNRDSTASTIDLTAGPADDRTAATALGSAVVEATGVEATVVEAPVVEAPVIDASRPSTTVATTPPADDLPTHVAVGHAALAEISYPWQQLLPEWEIEFLPGRDGLFGLTLVPEQRIEVYVRPDQAPGMVAHVVAHELGHAIDVTLNNGADRRRWVELRGLDAPWWPDSGATDFSTGAGDFAESFAAWQVGPAGFRSTLADPPDGPEIELLAELSAS